LATKIGRNGSRSSGIRIRRWRELSSLGGVLGIPNGNSWWEFDLVRSGQVTRISPATGINVRDKTWAVPKIMRILQGCAFGKSVKTATAVLTSDGPFSALSANFAFEILVTSVISLAGGTTTQTLDSNVERVAAGEEFDERDRPFKTGGDYFKTTVLKPASTCIGKCFRFCSENLRSHYHT